MTKKNTMPLAMILEGLIMASSKPLTIADMKKTFAIESQPSTAEITTTLSQIAKNYDHHGFELQEVASGFRFCIKQSLSPWINRLWEEKPPRYTQALLETLALIAYRQPITRSEIEEVRGVTVSSQIIRTLQEREWIRTVGYKDLPGRPAMLATTRHFLDHFNLKNLSDLPPLADTMQPEDKRPKQQDILADLAKDMTTQLITNDDASSQSVEPIEQFFSDLDSMEQNLTETFKDKK